MPRRTALRGKQARPAFLSLISFFFLLLIAVLVSSALTSARRAASSEDFLGGEAQPETWAGASIVRPGGGAERLDASPEGTVSAASVPVPAGPAADGQSPAPPPITIAIDPGHGGTDPGAMHRNSAGKIDLIEKDVTLSVAQRLAELLRAEGFRVVMTRDTDRDVNLPPRDWNGDGLIDDADELQARVDAINAAGAVAFVCLHSNGFPDPGERGTEVWWSTERPFADDTAVLAAKTQTAVLQRLLQAAYRSEDRGLKVDRAFKVKEGEPNRLFMLGSVDKRRPRATQIPGILGETLFVTNDIEAEMLGRPDIINAIAAGYRDGIVAYVDRVVRR